VAPKPSANVPPSTAPRTAVVATGVSGWLTVTADRNRRFNRSTAGNGGLVIFELRKSVISSFQCR